MLHLFVLYACMHFTARSPASLAGKTRCVERRVLFHADECRKELPKGGGVTEKSRYALSWFECQETRTDSWIPAGANDRVNRLYETQVSASDANALTALLTPLSPQERATFEPGELKRPFQKAFRGPGPWSFFIVGTGSTVMAFAVTNLDDFQFADMEADLSSSTATMDSAGIDFRGMAADAGVDLSYPTKMSRRAMPPPGGLASEP